MYRRGGSNTYDWRSIAERAAIKHKSLATNGLAAGGTVQSNPDLPRLSQQDEGIIAAIKLANEKLGEVGNPPRGRIDRQPGRPTSVIGTNDGIRRNDGIQRRDSGRSRALGPLEQIPTDFTHSLRA